MSWRRDWMGDAFSKPKRPEPKPRPKPAPRPRPAPPPRDDPSESEGEVQPPAPPASAGANVFNSAFNLEETVPSNPAVPTQFWQKYLQWRQSQNQLDSRAEFALHDRQVLTLGHPVPRADPSGFVIHRAKNGDLRFFNADLYGNILDRVSEHTLPDDGSWGKILAHHQRRGTKFTDRDFPPNASSLVQRGVANVDRGVAGKVHRWRRIGSLFEQQRSVQLKHFPDGRCCGYSTHEDNSPALRTSSADDRKVIDAARRLCLQGLRDEEGLRALAMPSIAKDMIDKKIFSTIAENQSPLSFKGVVDAVVIKREHEPDFLPQITVKVTLAFSGEPTLFDDIMVGEPSGVRQGRLGDCYILGALSVLAAKKHPMELVDIFPTVSPQQAQARNDAGVYAVRFWTGDSRRVVVVDDWIPCSADGKPAFAYLAPEHCTFWALIAEKAYSKLYGSYEAIVAGLEEFALQDLGGAVPTRIRLTGRSPWASARANPRKSSELWELLQRRLAEGGFMCVARLEHSTGARSENVEEAHAYGVLQLINFGRHRLVQIRNPWGRGHEWEGAWSDGSPEWNSVSRADKTRLGFADDNDGTWWMTFQDAIEQFDSIALCRFMRNFQTFRVVDQWKGLTAASFRNLHNCPYYMLTLDVDSEVVVELRQPSQRKSNRQYNPILPIIAGKADRLNNVQLHPRYPDGPATFNQGRSSVVELTLRAEDGPFSISPCCNNNGVESAFYLTVYVKPLRGANTRRATLKTFSPSEGPRDHVTGEVLEHPFVIYGDPHNPGKIIYANKKNEQRLLRQFNSSSFR